MIHILSNFLKYRDMRIALIILQIIRCLLSTYVSHNAPYAVSGTSGGLTVCSQSNDSNSSRFPARGNLNKRYTCQFETQCADLRYPCKEQTYGCRNFVPDIMHGPFQVGSRPSMAVSSHGLSNINHIDGGFLVSHCEMGVWATAFSQQEREGGS